MISRSAIGVRPHLKVCCIATIEEAELAIRHGANAVGLVSEMPSGPGVITDDRIEEIEEMIPPEFPLKKFKWPVSASRTIAVPTSKIWELISSPGSLPLYHPFCEKNPVFAWSGADSHDEVHYFNGVVLARRFSAWYDDVGYDLEIGRAGGRSSVVSWRIAAVKEQRSSIKITVYPHALQRIPPVVRWLPHLVRLRPQLGRYLQSVVKGLDWFITQGQPVRRNQFGAHNWFSSEVPNT